MKNIIKYFIVGLVSAPLFALATPVSWDFTSSVLRPLSSMWTNEVRVPYLTATSTTNNNTLPLLVNTTGTSTNFAVTTRLNLFGTIGTALSDFCVAITGGSGLCDGTDANSGGTVTSVDMSVPTGLSISGNPVTNSGTLALTLTAGYAIPSTTRMSLWDSAYSWGNHASQGYITDGNTGWNNTYGLITATNATASITNATTTNLAVSSGINLLGGGFVTTANALCQQLTGSAALCDGSDATGGTGSSISTSTTPNIGEVAYWTGVNTLGTVATGTLSESVTGLELSASRYLLGGTAALSLTSGYEIFLAASGTNWNTFYNTPSNRITDGNALTWSGNTLNFDGGNTPSGDLGGTWASPSVTDDSHAHTGTTISGLDISGDTNLSADGTEIVLTGDALSLGTALTFTNGTTTNFDATNISLFGGGLKTTANDLCIQLTGSSALCDGSDDGGGSGELSDWQLGGTGYIVPTTTVGIVVQSSSTITDLSMTNATATNLVVPTSINLFGAGAKTTANAFCIQLTGSSDLCDGVDGGGAGGSKWTDGTNFTYLTNTTYDLALGSNATETAPFWWDVSASQMFVGSQGGSDGTITFGTGTPWTIGYDYSANAFTLSSSTVLGANNFLNITSTTTIMTHSSVLTTMLKDNGVRIAIGSPTYQGMSQVLDQLVLHGRYRNDDWFVADCPIPGRGLQIVNDTGSGASATVDASPCEGYDFFEDTTGTLTSRDAVGYHYGELGSATANDGAGVFLQGINGGFLRFATSTPSMEVTARIGTIVSNSSTTKYYIGFTNIGQASNSFEAGPSSGCYFLASSTNLTGLGGTGWPNWYAVCRTSATAVTEVDTGVASTSINTGAGSFKTFRIDADNTHAVFYIKDGDNEMKKVADISSNYPSTAQLGAGIYFGRTVGTQAVQFHFFGLNTQWRRFTPIK